MHASACAPGWGRKMQPNEYFTGITIERLAEMSIRHNSPPPKDPARLVLWAIDLQNREKVLLKEAMEKLSYD